MSFPTCISCGDYLDARDEDPNGDMGCTCKRCEAQEAHDYDQEPDAVFDRRGERVDDPIPTGAPMSIAVSRYKKPDKVKVTSNTLYTIALPALSERLPMVRSLEDWRSAAAAVVIALGYCITLNPGMTRMEPYDDRLYKLTDGDFYCDPEACVRLLEAACQLDISVTKSFVHAVDLILEGGCS